MPVIGLGLLLPLDEASAEEGLRQAFELGRRTAQGTNRPAEAAERYASERATFPSDT